MSTHDLDAMIRARATAAFQAQLLSLRKTFRDQVESLLKANGSRGANLNQWQKHSAARLDIRKREGNAEVDTSAADLRTNLGEVLDLVFKIIETAERRAVEDAAVSDFILRVDALAEQTDELRGYVEGMQR